MKDYKATLDKLRTIISTEGLSALEDKYGIDVKEDNNHIILNYNMINVDWREPYGYICRGLVLGKPKLDVLCFGLAKFFNFGEGYVDDIDWSTAKVMEKLDGTLFNRWWSPALNRFVVTTRFQLPHETEANKVGELGPQWAKLFQAAFDKLNLPEQPKNETWCFEVMSPYNEIVVQHPTVHARLLCVRNLDTLVEVDIYSQFPSDVTPKLFDIRTFDDLSAYVKTLKGVEQEGMVVIDAKMNRGKAKGDDYLYRHRLKDSGNSIGALISIVKLGDEDEFIAYFPKFGTKFAAIREVVDDVISTHEAAYEDLKHLVDRKEFALAVTEKKLLCSDALFRVKFGSAKSIRDYWLTMDDNKFVRYIKDEVIARGVLSNNDEFLHVQ